MLISKSYHFGCTQDGGLKSNSPLTASNDIGLLQDYLIFMAAFLYF